MIWSCYTEGGDSSKIVAAKYTVPRSHCRGDVEGSAVDMERRRLGRERKAARRRWWCEDGRTREASARLKRSPPSTAAMRTSELVIADRLASCSCSPPLDAGAAPPRAFPLCNAQRNEPGCVVGEHAHALLAGPRLRETTAAGAKRTDGRWVLLLGCGGELIPPAALESEMGRRVKSGAAAEDREAAAVPMAAPCAGRWVGMAIQFEANYCGCLNLRSMPWGAHL